MVQTPNVKADSARAAFGADDIDGLWGQGGGDPDVAGLGPCWSKLLSHGDGKQGFILEDVMMFQKKEKQKKSLKIQNYVGSSLGKSLHG